MVLVASGGHSGSQEQQRQVVAPAELRHGASALTCTKHNKEQANRCCCCCSCFASKPLQQQTKATNCNSNISNNKTTKNHLDYKSCEKMHKKPSKLLALSKSRSNRYQKHQQLQRDLPPQVDCCGKLNCVSNSQSRSCKQLVAPGGCQLNEDLVNCAKCQLIARWTSAQARLTRSAKPMTENAAHFSKSSGQLNAFGDKLLRPMRMKSGDWLSKQPVESRKRAESSGDLREVVSRDCCKQAPIMNRQRHYYLSRASKLDQSTVEELDEEEGSQRKSPIGDCKDDFDEAEISSLTNSSINDDDDDGHQAGTGAFKPDVDDLSLSSCYEEEVPRVPRKGLQSADVPRRPPSLRGNRRQPMTVALGIGARKLRPAPLPPGKGAGQQPVGRSARTKKQQQQQQQQVDGADRVRCDHSLDSGNSSGGDTTNLPPVRSAAHHTSQPKTHQSDNSFDKKRSAAVSSGLNDADQRHIKRSEVKPDLLSESEIFSIEHFLRSHKSSIYVCGCMANLYLTSTQLVDNGRCSMPSADGWQLSRTGVPVLTFDSGLTRNRNKRRLSINLAERGSGFVLWSDIIDHLSNYRAYQTKTSNPASSSSPAQATTKPDEDTTCDTFHVMYLSTNHRIMVGLSFDDARCARSFLRQVELVTSDPANISLTGPKLARRLASVGRLSRLLSGSRSRTSRQLTRPTRKRPKSINSNHEHETQPPEAVELAADSGRPVKPSKLRSIIHRQTTQQLARINNTSCANERRFSTGVDYTWSTLKRAIRFGQQHHGKQTLQVLDLNGQLRLSPNPDLLEQEGVAGGPFKPKPLASLAMSGKIYRTSKKLPRKCDISAPCLFQHVTSVDLDGLERLYSRSLVQAGASRYNNKNCIDCSESAGDSPCARHIKQLSAAAKVAQPDPASSGGHSQISSEMNPQQQQQLVHSPVTAGFTNTTTSSSSCYSSASISPASSEYGAAHLGGQRRPNHFRQQQQQQQRVLRNPTRPTPPKVPQRTSSTDPAAAQLAVQLHHQKQQQQQHQQQQEVGGANKIQAIIRELQAQTSAELVDAKKKLMADIADQVLARATSSSSSCASSSSSSSSDGGAISRL